MDALAVLAQKVKYAVDLFARHVNSEFANHGINLLARGEDLLPKHRNQPSLRKSRSRRAKDHQGKQDFFHIDYYLFKLRIKF